MKNFYYKAIFLFQLLFIIGCNTTEGYLLNVHRMDQQIYFETLLLDGNGKYEYFNYQNDFYNLTSIENGKYEMVNDTIKIHKEDHVIYFFKESKNRVNTLYPISTLIYPTKKEFSISYGFPKQELKSKTKRQILKANSKGKF